MLIGRILPEILYYSDKTTNPSLKRTEIVYSIAFGVFTVGSLVGLLLLSNADKFTKNANLIENPKDLVISGIYRVKESEKLKFSGKIANLKESAWSDVEITGKLFINGKLSDKKQHTIPILQLNKTEEFVIDYDGFDNDKVSDSVRLDCQVKGKRSNRH